MQSRTKSLTTAAIAAVGVLALGTVARAAVTVDGTLSPGEGYSLVATQTQITNSYSDVTGSPEAPGTTNPSGNYTNLSNVYAQIDTVNDALDLFIGGSMAEDQDSDYEIALQLNGYGVSNLNGQSIAGTTGSSIDKIEFNGFKPTAYFSVFPGQPSSSGTITMSGTPNSTYTGSETFGVSYTDLTGKGYAAPATVGAVLNNALVNTIVGSGSAGDPGFAGANTGLEMSIPLSTLGYTPGTSIEAMVFPATGSDGKTDDQILPGFTSFSDSGGDTSYDYVYIDNNSSVDPSGRQFVSGVYPGSTYFTINAPATVPEPASIGLLAMGAIGLMGRRRRA